MTLIPPSFWWLTARRSTRRKSLPSMSPAPREGWSCFSCRPILPSSNPDEWVNKSVKHDRIARAVPLTRDELKAVAVEALERLKTCPRIVRGFFGDPKLAYLRA